MPNFISPSVQFLESQSPSLHVLFPLFSSTLPAPGTSNRVPVQPFIPRFTPIYPRYFISMHQATAQTATSTFQKPTSTALPPTLIGQ